MCSLGEREEMSAKGVLLVSYDITLQVLEYFASLDMPIMEVYGQSESSGPHTSCFPHAWKIGSIGRDVSILKTELTINAMLYHPSVV